MCKSISIPLVVKCLHAWALDSAMDVNDLEETLNIPCLLLELVEASYCYAS